MTRKTLLVPLLLLFIIGQLWARPFDPIKDSGDYRTKALNEPAKIIAPDAPLEIERVADNYYPVPFRDDPLGETTIIGYTWYDYQHNGSVGKMVARDENGGTHFTWTAGFNSQQDPRHVLYNYISPDGDLLTGADDHAVVDNATRSGYCCLDLLPVDDRAVIFYHAMGHVEQDPQFVGSALSVDWVPGIGAFQASYPLPWPDVQLAWPHGAADERNFIHIIATENDEDEDILWQRVAYWRGSGDEDYLGWEFNDNQVAINLDTTGAITAVAAASPQSEKVVLAWHHNRIGTRLQQPNGDWDQARGGWQRNNDLVYIVSEDGEDWDWENGIESITKVRAPIPELAEIDMNAAYGDIYRPYCDVDIQFDPWQGEDNLYAVFGASGFQEEPVADDDPEPVDIVYAVMGHLWFWNSEEDTVTMIYDGWYNQYMNNPAAPADRHFRNGVWRLNADRGSIAFNPDDPGTIYVVWVNFPHVQDDDVVDNQIVLEFLEGAQDTSEAGYLNADIMVSISTDWGITWREPINITETIWDEDGQIDRAPAPGECMSENWVSVAELADGFLHIMYIQDRDAGGIPQEEGTATNSPVVYQKIALGDLPLNDPIVVPDGILWHNYYNPRPYVHSMTRTVGVPTPADDVEVSAIVEPMGDRNIADAILQYVVIGDNADTLETDMQAGDENLYFASIPSQAEGTYVWYRIRAIDNEGVETIEPEGHWGSYIVRNEGGLIIHDVQYRPDGWDTDHSPYNSFEVTVTGVVTTPSDFNNKYGAFAIQEAGGEDGYWSGVFVKGGMLDLEAGSLVRVTGVVMERDPADEDKWRFQTFIQIANDEAVEVLGNDALPAAIEVEIGDLVFATKAESLEGVLVHLGAFQIGNPNDVNPAILGDYWPIAELDTNDTDESWITTYGIDIEILEADFEYSKWVQGTVIAEMTGVFAENLTYAIAPRNAQDIGDLAVDVENIPLPNRVELAPAYPNPFNSMTRIGFKTSKAGYVNLSVFDLSGRLVANVIEGEVQAGNYETTIDASALATGVYMLRLEAGNTSASQKLVLVK